MKQDDLINQINTDTNVTKADIKKVLDGIAVAVYEAVAKGDDVTLPGLGRIRTIAVAARVGRNPRTGDKLNIPAKNRVTFVVAKALKDAVNG
jgi:DNA-binding protein HU-beta